MLAEWTGLEPATPGVTGRYSNQLNYHSVLLKNSSCGTASTSLLATGTFFARYTLRIIASFGGQASGASRSGQTDLDVTGWLVGAACC